MTRKYPNLRVKLLRLLRPWHRRFGIFSAVFLLLMASSGIVINHSHDLAIDSSHVQQSWLLDYYGIAPPNLIKVYQTTPNIIAAADNQLWFNNTRVLHANNPIIGIARLPNLIIASTTQSLMLISPAGELMEIQDASTGLPQHITAIGTASNQVWLNTAKGVFVADDELIEWQPAQPLIAINWVTELNSQELTETVLAKIRLNARSTHLTWERVTLDVHSGRIFGKAGSLFMDGIAIILILLSISGLLIWWQQKPAKHPK